MPIRIAVDGDRLQTRSGLLRAQRIGGGAPGSVRVALVATSALLLGGDCVELEIEVAPGSTLELVDVAGTVAYAGRGESSAWHTRIAVAAGGRLRWTAEPFVIADGADVTRSLDLQLAGDAQAMIRETLVFGRTGELGGALLSRTTVTRDGRAVLREEQRFDAALRQLPGILGQARVTDAWLAIGGTPPTVEPPARTYELAEGAGWLTRWLGTSLADSPLIGR